MKINQIINERFYGRDRRGRHSKVKMDVEGAEKFDPKYAKDYFYEYAFEYDVQQGDFKHISRHALRRDNYDSVQDYIDYIVDEHGIQKQDQRWVKRGKYGFWVGFSLGEFHAEDDEDEDGPYSYIATDIESMGFIVSERPLNNNVLHRIADKLESEMDRDAADAIEGEMHDHRDAKEYARDPYAYYGVSRSDFY